MGSIQFIGDMPFELVPQREPNTTSEGENVVVTLPVFVPDFPAQTAEIRVILSLQQAKHLFGQIQSAIVTAQVNERLGR